MLSIQRLAASLTIAALVAMGVVGCSVDFDRKNADEPRQYDNYTYSTHALMHDVEGNPISCTSVAVCEALVPEDNCMKPSCDDGFCNTWHNDKCGIRYISAYPKQ